MIAESCLRKKQLQEPLDQGLFEGLAYRKPPDDLCKSQSVDSLGRDNQMTNCAGRIVSVVIPIFNEESNVLALHESLRNVLRMLGSDYEIVFVDDGSTDDTFNMRRIQHRNRQTSSSEGSNRPRGKRAGNRCQSQIRRTGERRHQKYVC